MAIPKLYYFDLPGRGELIRLLFTIGGVEFEDIRFSGDEWRAKYKALSPTGQSPMLEVDGKFYAESHALALYAATLAKLLPTDPAECMSVTSVLFRTEDLWQPMMRALHLPKDQQPEGIKKCSTEDLPPQLETFDRLVAAKKSTDQIDLADIVAFSIMDMLQSKFFGIDVDLNGKYKTLHERAALVAQNPKIEKYMKDHPRKPHTH